ncbi:MAG: hypothetical protein HC867_08890, partial [Bacteroidia bacterium]|nr:hypothetical protein [Bacteroidia bacterium]
MFNNLQAIVTPGVPLTATATKTDVLCNGGATGTLTANITAGVGTPPFQYSLDGINFQASNVFTELPAGTYTVFFRDNNGCSGTTNSTISQPAALSSFVSTLPVVCFGQNNGTIRVTASGGKSPYTFSLDGAIYQPADSFNVAAGNYTAYTRDMNGCITSQTVSVTEPSLLNFSIATQDASCDGGADGRITITANGGNGGYQYSLDGTNFQTSAVFNVNPGNYTVTVKDSKNCNAFQS